MEEVDPETALTAVESERERRRERAVDALGWFRDREGLVARTEAVSALAAAHDWSEAEANRAVGDVVGDLVDPVQQVVHPERGKMVGVIEYYEYPESGAYGYVDYDDVDGRRKRVVCSECVKQANADVEVAHATEGEGTAPGEATWPELITAVEAHYEAEHGVEPSEVEVGASLASGTTISGNTAFHKGNDGVGSGLDADTLNGSEPSGIPVDNFDGSNGAAGEVLQTDGTALSFGSVGGNVPNYEEDPNSPFTASSTSSVTFSLAEPADSLLIQTDTGNQGFDQMQVNGVTTTDYDSLDISGTVRSSIDHFEIPKAFVRGSLRLRARSNFVAMSTTATGANSNRIVGGDTFAASGPITQITLSDAVGNNRQTRLRVYSLDV